jgi:hypothetical protein
MSLLNTFSKDIINALDNIDKNNNIVPSKQQTKEWRKQQDWYKNGKSNECEKYQRNIVENITDAKCKKTNTRINARTFQLKSVSSPLKTNDGFDWTEDFDGFQNIYGKQIYYNMKMVCDAGGAQTRTLREVYHFIQAQLECALQQDIHDTYFVNILDGDESFKHVGKFRHLKNIEKYENVKSYVFVGDTLEFKNWWTNLPTNDQQYDTTDQN